MARPPDPPALDPRVLDALIRVWLRHADLGRGTVATVDGDEDRAVAAVRGLIEDGLLWIEIAAVPADPFAVRLRITPTEAGLALGLIAGLGAIDG